MKRLLDLELIRRMLAHPRGKRRLLVAGGVAALCFVAIGSFGIWLAVSAVQQVAQAGRAPIVQAKVQAFREQAGGVVGNLEPCWRAAQEMLGVGAWLGASAGQNLRVLKLACLGGDQKKEAQS